jgi:hypothetical protein
MAQEADIQTVRVQKPYRNTDMGGYDKTWVFKDGVLIRPNVSQRSRSGNHGEDIWYLTQGKYAIISAHRANLKNGARPFEATLQCIEITNGESRILKTTVLYVMRVSMSDLKEWATAICPPS